MNFFYLSDRARLFLYFISLSFFGAAALQIPAAYQGGVTVPYIDALFTAVSALCVTGLSTVDMSVYTTFGFVIIMLLIELGGLGIVTFVSLYLAIPAKKVSLVNRRMVRDFFIDDVEANPRKILSSILTFTGLIQLVGALLLIKPLIDAGSDSPVFDACFLAVSAFCNAGFSPYSDSLAGFTGSVSVNLVICALIILGGLGFIVLQDSVQVLSLKKRRLSLHSRIVISFTLFLIFWGAVLFFIIDYNGAFRSLPLHQKILAAFFESVTTRTAGFETIAQKAFSVPSNLVASLLMFIGGSPGSVAGGIKTTTFLITALYLFGGNEDKVSINLISRNIDPRTTGKALSVVSRSVVLVFLSIFLLSMTEFRALAAGTVNLLDLMFECFSAFATVGLSRGMTSNLSFFGKLVIILTMFIGRTGIFAMMLKTNDHSAKKFIEYPQESILIG